MTETLAAIAYAAGLFDGEGTISTHKSSENGCTIYVSLVSTNREVIDWMVANFGGYINDVAPSSYAKKEQWKWLAGKQTKEFLTAVLPYLIIKQMLALWALEALGMKFQRTHEAGVRRRLIRAQISSINSGVN